MHSHIRLVATTDTTTVVAVDGPTHGNACHVYEVRTKSTADGFEVLATSTFQPGPIKEHGVNGVQHADLLAIIRDRLDFFQTGPFKSPGNEVTAGFVSAAIASEDNRTRRRVLAGTEGTSKA
jgi:hypothetical protein